MCKTPDASLQDELPRWTFVIDGYFYFMQIRHASLDDLIAHYTAVIMLVARSK